MNKRKLTSLLIAFSMILTLIPFQAFATDSLAISAAEVSATLKAGERVDVDIFIDSNPGITGGTVDIKFDSTSFKLVGVKNENNLLTCTYDGYSSFPVESGTYTLSWDGGVQHANTSSTGRLATLTFEVVTGATCGEKAITVGRIDFTNTDDEVIGGTGTAGKITLISEITEEQSITNITPPAKGQTPVTTGAAEPANTTVKSITWYDGEKEMGNTEKFLGGKAYTVKATLSPNEYYAFAEDISGTINGNNATVTKSGNDIVLAYTFPALPAKEVSSIAITSQSTNTQYIEGQSFDPSGMEVTATYDDGTTGTVNGYTVSPDPLTTGTTSVTVTYDGKSTTVSGISVLAKEITSIEITKEPTKRMYQIGDTADWSGMVVTATYNDGSEKVLDSSEYTVSGFDTTSYAETQTITVTANGKTDTFTISVDKKTISASDAFNYAAPANLVYDDTAKTAAVTKKGSYNGTAKVVYKQNNASVASPTDAGTYDVYVSADETATYKAIAETKIGSFTIAPKQLTLTGATAQSRDYEKDKKDVEITAVTFGETAPLPVLGTDYTVTGIMDNDSAGTAKAVTATVNLNNPNYSLSSNTVTTTVKIDKIAWTALSANGSAKYGNSGEVDLSSYIAEGGSVGQVTVNDTDAVLASTPTVSGKKLNFTFANDAAKKDKTATVTVPVTGSTNYNDYSVTVTLTVVDKTPQTSFKFAQAAQTKTYGDADFTVKATGAVSGSNVTYTSSDPTVATVDNSGKVHILKASTSPVTITATASATDEYAEARASYNLTVNKATITITAKNKTVYVGEEAPVLGSSDYTVTGLAKGEALKKAPTVKYAGTPDTSKKGTVAIQVADAEAPDGGNYNAIKYVAGTLTIQEKSSVGGGGGMLPGTEVQKPVIEPVENAKVTLSEDGTTAKIEAAEGYEIADVIVNGQSKGKVTEVTGLKTGDKVEVKVVKKEDIDPADLNRIIEGVQNTKVWITKTSSGKGWIKINYKKSKGFKVDYYEVFRKAGKNSKFGKKAFYKTKKNGLTGYYKNTKSLKKGTRYYFKIRGVRVIDGKKYYTKWSKTYYRIAK